MVTWPEEDRPVVYIPPLIPGDPETPDALRVRLGTARLREGLSADDERLSEILRSGYSADPERAGIYTRAEQQDIYGDHERVEAARAVLADAGDEFGGIAVCWREGRRGIRVQLTGELDRWRERLVAVIDPARLVIEQVSHGEAELRRRGEQVRAQSEQLAAEGIHVTRSRITVDGFVIDYLAADRVHAEQRLQERFGDFATIRYAGASHDTFTACPFASWLAEGNWLHVFYGLPCNGEQPAGCQAYETDTAVLVALTIKDWRAAKTLIGGYTAAHASVQLHQPLGNRVVIDDAGNVARPHWTKA